MNCSSDETNYSSDEMELQTPSLLMLNDDCLMAISKFLNYKDYINLGMVCTRLRAVASKYKNIHLIKYDGNVAHCGYISYHLEPRYKRKIRMIRNLRTELLEFLSAVGENVLSVKITDGANLALLEILAEKCKNLRTVNVENYEGPLHFKNLTELKFGSNVTVTIEQLKYCVENSPDIKSFEYNGDCDRKFMELLKMLPKIKNLKVKHVYKSRRLNQALFDSLLAMKNLTSFSFRSNSNRNDFLIELGKKVNLLKLEFYMPCNKESFDVLRYFRNLEVLSMNIDKGLVQVLEVTELPVMLKIVKLDGIKISCNSFLSLIKQMKFLKEIDLGLTGRIFSDSDKCKHFWQKYGF